MKLLHLDSSILGQNSVSRQLSADIVQKISHQVQPVIVKYRDLADNPIPHLSGAYLAASGSPGTGHDSTLQSELALSSEVLNEFINADVVVIGAALYNFSIPSQLKAWIDRIAINGKTFRYTEAGPVGLVGDKKIILAIARGGYYGHGSSAEALEHAESYLRAIFSFIGVTKLQVVIAEGHNVGPDHRTRALDIAAQQVAALVI
ncbi:FMN-dependent NADH-azoreductase [Citrobacter freundii complex sp. CFNIH2]|uniref:FMN-dependent NADH-azoreductase n=1 Tax=Citrobacter freundii complex sp. CFNIH2 TaxID=2066049 RepID=UPI000C86CBE3|nr:NAD(P)H-dependent oxidoreductase [Citrobacter freundii complex sp. CFNIH2]AUO66001.1 FMN-dependent NADH-azoreductase [Citrobacter freundii complex sp. CFNIH2]